MLRSHPEIHCENEVFCIQSDPGESDDSEANGRAFLKGELKRMVRREGKENSVDPQPAEVLEQLHKIFAQPKKACGFKLKFPTQSAMFPELIEEFKSLGPKLKLIVLCRRNAIKQAISKFNMRRIRSETDGVSCNLTQSGPDQADFESKFEIDVPKVLGYARNQVRQREEFDKSIAQFQSETSDNILRLDYEHLLIHPNIWQRVFRFLGVSRFEEVNSQVRKMTPDDLSEAILNYDELEKEVAGTPLERFLK